MSYMARAKRELCVHVMYGDVPGTEYVNQMYILASYSMPQENVLQVLVPFCPSWKLYSRLKFPYVKFCGMCPMLLKMRVPKRKDKLNLRFLIENL